MSLAHFVVVEVLHLALEGPCVLSDGDRDIRHLGWEEWEETACKSQKLVSDKVILDTVRGACHVKVGNLNVLTLSPQSCQSWYRKKLVIVILDILGKDKKDSALAKIYNVPYKKIVTLKNQEDYRRTELRRFATGSSFSKLVRPTLHCLRIFPSMGFLPLSGLTRYKQNRPAADIQGNDTNCRKYFLDFSDQ